MLPAVPENDTKALKARQDALEWFESLNTRKHQWAARWTWQHFTMGVHSTQRSESIHSAIKKFLGATTLLVQLSKKLQAYQRDLDHSAALVEARGAFRRVTTHTNDLPCVAMIADKVTDYALEILRAQQAQQPAYYLYPALLPPGVMPMASVYHVSRQHVPSSSPATITGLADDDVQCRLAEDHGLPTAGGSTARLTSLLTCTCQFASCWGLPCRHMLRLYQHFQVPELLGNVVNSRWFKYTEQDISEKRRMLLRTLPKERTGVAPSRALNKQEIFSFLTAESKAVIEVASNSQEGMELFIEMLDTIKTKLHDMHPIVPGNIVNAPHVRNPTSSTRGVGRPQTKRLKSAWER
jgi:hypothetical protein